MNKMDSKYLDEVHTENDKPSSVISMLERTQIAMYETESTLQEILNGLKPDLTDKADEMNVTGMLDAAENTLRKANRCKWLAKEINELLYGQY